MFWDRDECSGTNVLHGSSDSLGSELNLSQGSEMRTSSQMNPIWFLFHLGELSRLAGLARLIIWTGHVTRGNFPCNLQRNGVALHCIASCKEDFLVWHPMFATSLATKNCVASCRESRSSCYATSWSVWHPHCNLSRNFLRMNQSQYDIIRMPLTFLNTRRA